MILHDLESFNTFREKQHYNALECLAVFKKEGVLPDSTELVEKIVAKDAVFSPQGRANLLQGLDALECSECDSWIYKCQPYNMLLHCLRDVSLSLTNRSLVAGCGNALLLPKLVTKKPSPPHTFFVPA